METKFQTSFIPKQPVTEAPKHHASAASLVFLVSFILFIASGAAAGAVFIYSQVISKNIADGNAQLNANKNAFDANTIKEITRLNDRINSTYSLLKNHKGVSPLFQVLSSVTLKTVQFTSFAYSSTGEKVTLAMNGKAYNYETVALQSMEFTDPSLKNVFKSPIFGDLSLDSAGNVSFGFSASIDPLLVNYYKLKQEEYSRANSPEVTAPDVAPAGLGGGSGAPAGFTQTSPSTSGNNSGDATAQQ